MSRTEVLRAEEAYTIDEAARIKRVSPDFIRRAVRRTDGERLRAKKVGRGYRIDASELEAWWGRLDDAGDP